MDVDVIALKQQVKELQLEVNRLEELVIDMDEALKASNPHYKLFVAQRDLFVKAQKS